MSVPYAHVRESAVKCRACMSVQYAQCGIVHSWKSDPCPQSAFVAQRPLPMHEGDPLSAVASDGRGRAVLLLLAIVLKWSYISCVGLLEAERRVGMADAFHCYDSVARHALNIREEDASSLSSGSSDDVVEDVDAAEPRSGFSRWVRTCRVLRKLLGRGHGNHFLSEAYKTFGIAGRPKITLPGTAVRRCVSNGMWLSRPAAGRRPAVPGPGLCGRKISGTTRGTGTG